jgi:plastocyanin
VAHRTGKRGALVALLAAGSITLGAVPSMSAPTIIKANSLSNTWDPDTSRVVKGKRVVWKNPANFSTEHNVRSYGANWTLKKQVLKPGESFGKRFKKRGTFRYRCTRHSSKQNGVWTGMVGRIRVTR